MPKDKLDAPTNVSAVLEGTEVLVNWDAVEDAESYEVEYTGTTAQGSTDNQHYYTDDTSMVLDAADYRVMSIKVRALPGPKHEGQPEQAGGPKGDWSEDVVVNIPPPEVTPH